jgi:hypothetical protein
MKAPDKELKTVEEYNTHKPQHIKDMLSAVTFLFYTRKAVEK